MAYVAAKSSMGPDYKMGRYIRNDIMYMHEDMGGIGQNSILDLVNTERLMVFYYVWKKEDK